VLSKAQQVVAVDTGLGHLTAAVGTPAVALYGPTDPTLTSSYGRNQQILSSTLPCAPCLSKRCLLPKDEQDKAPAWPPCLAQLTPDRVAHTRQK